MVINSMELNDTIKREIVDNLKKINPGKIIIFGSYAIGKANSESDIDLFIIKNVKKDNIRYTRLRARKCLRNIIKKYKIGFDVFVDNEKRISERINKIKDPFYIEIINHGKIIYEQ